MKKAIFFNTRPYQTRIGYTEDGVLKNILYHREQEPSLVGGIYKGKVVRSPKGLDFVFVDIGQKRSGFLFKKKKSHRSEYKEGDIFFVQVVSDPIYEKGCRLTADISFSSRFLVYMPQQEKKVTFSRRISGNEEKEKLSKVIEDFDEPGTFIVRTLAQGKSDKEIKKDLKKLKKEWKDLQKQFSRKKGVGEIEKGLGMDLRYLKDHMSEEVSEIFVDQKEAYIKIKKFIKSFMPEFLPRLKLFSEKKSLFEAFELESQIESALSRRVRFKGGGFLIFEELEALTVIDVNTGRYMGKGSHKESILKINLEAARTLSKHIRLRHLAGIIIVDFIDMEEIEDREKVISVLQKELESDKAYPRIFPMTDLGLVHVTRKRSYPALSSFAKESCSSCKGEGKVASRSAVAIKILNALEKRMNQNLKKRKKISIFCHPEVKIKMEDHQKSLQLFKKKLSFDLELVPEDSFSVETFKIESSQ